MTVKQIAKGALLLTLTGLLLRLIGFFYRIYQSNMIGNEGMGLVQLFFSVYSLVLIVLSSGLSTAVSNLTARSEAVGGNSVKIIKTALLLVFLIGIPVGLIVHFSSGFIATTIVKDERTLLSFRFIGFLLPVVAASSVMRGYFYGLNHVLPSSASQMLEQAVKVIAAVLLYNRMIPKGLDYACLAVVIASVAGDLASFLMLGFLIVKNDRQTGKESASLPFKKLISDLMKISVPLSFNRLISSLLHSAEIILIPRRLMLSGMQYAQGMDLFGRFTGMASPLIMFPSIFTASLATMLVPTIARDMHNDEMLKQKISKSVQLTMVIGFLFSAIFNSCAHEFGELLFAGKNVGEVIQILSWSCIFVYLNQTLSGIMHGLNKHTAFMWNSMIGCSLRILVVYFLVPLKGITVYVWGISVSFAISAVLNLYTIIKSTGVAIDFRKWFFKPALVFLAMKATGQYITAILSAVGVHGKLHFATVILGTSLIGLGMMFGVGAISFRETVHMLGIKKPRNS
jgi:stage V sporulation protein B